MNIQLPRYSVFLPKNKLGQWKMDESICTIVIMVINIYETSPLWGLRGAPTGIIGPFVRLTIPNGS